MLQVVLLTLLILAAGWYFTLRKERKPQTNEPLSKTQQKKLGKASKNSDEKANNADDNQAKPQIQIQDKTNMPSKKPKNKVDHPFFFKSFKKNESTIIDFDISKDNQFLAIASKDMIHILYNIKKDSLIRISSSRLL